MDYVLFVIAGKTGIEKTLFKECYNQRECLVDFEITENMLPVSNIYAYNFKEGGNVVSTSLKVEFDAMSENFVSSDLNLI